MQPIKPADRLLQRQGCAPRTLTQGFRIITTARITTSAMYCLNRKQNKANRLYTIPSALLDCAWKREWQRSAVSAHARSTY
jgi:hypothetical protein